MPIYTMPRRPAALPVASRSCDMALLRKLIAERSSLCAHATVLVGRARFLQRAVAAGNWYSRQELRNVQRHAVTVLRAAHAHRALDDDVLHALDRLQAFVSGIAMDAAIAA